MTDAIPGMVENPATQTPPRLPGSVRRTTGLDITRPEGLRSPLLVVRAVARDLVTPAARPGRVAASASVTAEVDLGAGARLRMLETEPARPALAALSGRGVTGGFRAAAAEILDASDAGTPLAALLDDLPVAVLISGYAPALAAATSTDAAITMRERAGAPKRDICSGWRSGGVMMSAIDRGHPIPLRRGPQAPVLTSPDDPLGWHAEATGLPPLTLRRRRRIDVLPAAGAADGGTIDAMFRDTYVGEDGMETVVHEYALHAEFGPDGHHETPVIRRIAAQPRVLPWPECPVAAASADRLTGQPVAGLSRWVRRELTGTSTCTHLNDLLRSLSGVPAMLAEMDRRPE
ncbi:MAG TPA: DUF2889 domain-containing protein [Amycolatopsis sp.]|nr:DUF2889 domain-containing protein [Amycolatopsis sp.]